MLVYIQFCLMPGAHILSMPKQKAGPASSTLKPFPSNVLALGSCILAQRLPNAASVGRKSFSVLETADQGQSLIAFTGGRIGPSPNCLLHPCPAAGTNEVMRMIVARNLLQG